jgi:hypothetical protein
MLRISYASSRFFFTLYFLLVKDQVLHPYGALYAKFMLQLLIFIHSHPLCVICVIRCTCVVVTLSWVQQLALNILYDL